MSFYGVVATASGGTIAVDFGSQGKDALFLAAGGGLTDIAWSPDGQDLAYALKSGIAIYSVSKRSETLISSLANWEGCSSPTWNRVTSQIAFIKDNKIYRTSQNGQPDILFTSGSPIDDLDWSADGRYIAYAEGCSGCSRICVLDLAAGSTSRLTPEAGWAVAPRWSPDGRQLVFVLVLIDGSTRSSAEIYVIDSDASGLKRIASVDHSGSGFQISPVWSRDGRFIYYVARKTGEPPALFRVPALGGSPERVDEILLWI